MIDESNQFVSVAGDRAAVPRSWYHGFRFGLRHLFWFVTATSVLLAILAGLPGGGYAPLAVLLALSVVALHLMSTAVGSHLRAEADRETAVFWQSADDAQADWRARPYRRS